MFVEHAVVRQLHLAVLGLDHAVPQHAGRVIAHTIAQRRVAHDQRDSNRGTRDLLQGSRHAGVAGGAQQQVLGWIGRESEFGKDDNIGPAAQAFGTIDDAPGIAGNIPDQQIDLRQCNRCRHLETVSSVCFA